MSRGHLFRVEQEASGREQAGAGLLHDGEPGSALPAAVGVHTWHEATSRVLDGEEGKCKSAAIPTLVVTADVRVRSGRRNGTPHRHWAGEVCAFTSASHLCCEDLTLV